MIAIAPATPDDVETILAFIRELAEYEQLEHEVVATEVDVRRTLFEDRAAEVLIAREDGAAIGFALFFPNYSTFLAKPGIHLEDLFVRRAHRNRGVGRALLREVARIAIERGCGRLEWAVLDWNAPAIAFYAKLGAKPIDGWTIHRLTGDSLVTLARRI